MANITVTIKNPNESHEIEILQNATVKELKNEIVKKFSLQGEKFRLIFAGKFLQNDDDILGNIGIQNEFTIILAIRSSNLNSNGIAGLLPANEAAQHGKKLAEALTTVFNEVPNVLLTFFNAHPDIQSVLESSRKSIKKILNIANCDKITNPEKFEQKFPKVDDDSQVSDQKILDIIFPNSNLTLDTSLIIMGKEMFQKLKEIDRNQLLALLMTPFGQNLLNSPYFEEFVINFLSSNEVYNTEDRQKILKLLKENPSEGLGQIDKIWNEKKAPCKRKFEESGDEKQSKFMKKVVTFSEKFQNELRLLEAMGFPDKIANLTALQDTNGDFDDAVENLIQHGY